MKDSPKTFVASIRTDLRDIASLAIYLNKRNVFVNTPARIASKVIAEIAEIAQRENPVKTQTDAVSILRQLGYKDPQAEGTRHFNALTKEIGREKTLGSQLEQNCKIVQNLMKSDKFSDIENKTLVRRPTQAELTAMQAEGLIAETPNATNTTDAVLTAEEISDENSRHNAEIKELQEGFASGTPTVRPTPSSSSQVTAGNKTNETKNEN